MEEVLRMAARGRVWLVGSGQTKINPIHGTDLAHVVAAALAAPEAAPEITVGGLETFSQLEIGELAFRAVDRRSRYGLVSPSLLRRVAGWLKPFNRNAAAPGLMFSTLGERDAVAPACGTRRLEDFYPQLVVA
jgi:nucleoside-diphosphate-sugar epimerase